MAQHPHIQFRVPDDVYAALRAAAKKNGTTPNLYAQKLVITAFPTLKSAREFKLIRKFRSRGPQAGTP